MAGKDAQSVLMAYLNNPVKSVLREEIFNHRLFYELKLAAASNGTYLKIYVPPVDNEGCDMILEDNRDFSKKIQIKTKTSKHTRSWEIHKWLLLPDMQNMDSYGFTDTFCPNRPGGFLVLNIIENNLSELEIEYLFVDIHILILITEDIINLGRNVKNEAISILSKLRDNRIRKIEIKECLLVKLNNAESFLKFCGFWGNYDIVNSVLKIGRVKYARTKYFAKNIQTESPEEYSAELVSQANKARMEANRILEPLMQKYFSLNRKDFR